MYLPHGREETPDQMGTAGRMLLLAEKLGTWEGGVDKGSHGKETKNGIGRLWHEVLSQGGHRSTCSWAPKEDMTEVGVLVTVGVP